MKEILVSIGLVAVILGAVFLINREQEGPAERFGREVDEAVDATGDSFDRARENAADAVEHAGEEVGEALR